MEPDLVPSRNVLGHANNCALRSAEEGGTQPDMHHRASAVAEAAHVSNQNGTVPDYGDSAEQVLDCFLCREGDGEPAHAETRQDGGSVLPPGAEDAKRIAARKIKSLRTCLPSGSTE